MFLPPQLDQKILQRFDHLIQQGQRFLDETNPDGGVGLIRDLGVPTWKINYASLLAYVLPPRHYHRHLIQDVDNQCLTWGWIHNHLAYLKGIRDDYANGFLGNFAVAIEAEMASDYMRQAEQLLTEGQSGKYDHIPAAVLAGAVLEKSLRAICGQQAPPVPTRDAKERPMTLNGLVDALKKAGAFNEMVAKQLRAWADIRNHAAHGEFDLFTRSDVELMLKGVTAFLAGHLR
ncbi:MAG TPA: DUF4145 domain-containing protein [Phycisphaerales bacterium]|nr:DUF4145 domain-containing protein [Phycisphaerales bacterium]